MNASDQERIEDILEFATTISLIVSEGQVKFEATR